jgi:hypothetical protein
MKMGKRLTTFLGGALVISLLALPILHAQINPGTFNPGSPGPIGGTTPSTGNFTQLNATSININGVPVYAGHGLIGVQSFTSAGTFTYTPDAGTASVIVEVQAAGGGSGGCAATTAAAVCVSGSGGAGSYAKAWINTGFAGASIVVPPKGPGAAAGGNNAPQAGTASFGTQISCAGGFGGFGNNNFAPATYGFAIFGETPAPACTVTGTGVVSIANVGGNGSFPGYYWGIAALQQLSGAGGSSPLGQGGAPTLQNSQSNLGNWGTGYGYGTAGNCIGESFAATGGSLGGPGAVFVYEFN